VSGWESLQATLQREGCENMRWSWTCRGESRILEMPGTWNIC
jgi:hypothetical protein